MHKIISGSIFLMLLAVSGCERIDFPDDTPLCVERMARSLRRDEVRNPPAMIIEFTFKSGERYYYVPPYCCDMFSALYDSDCNLVCAPDGGFTGMGDGRCPDDIMDNVESSKVIWEDERGEK